MTGVDGLELEFSVGINKLFLMFFDPLSEFFLNEGDELKLICEMYLKIILKKENFYERIRSLFSILNNFSII